LLPVSDEEERHIAGQMKETGILQYNKERQCHRNTTIHAR